MVLVTVTVLVRFPAHFLTMVIEYADGCRLASGPAWPAIYGFAAMRRFIVSCSALESLPSGVARWWLTICAYRPSLVDLPGVVTMGLSAWAALRPSDRLNFGLLQFASVHMRGSMLLLALGALL